MPNKTKLQRYQAWEILTTESAKRFFQRKSEREKGLIFLM